MANKKVLSLIMAFSMFVMQLPTITFADSADSIFYVNDFEQNVLPNETGGVVNKESITIETIDTNKVMKFYSKFDGTDNWENNKYEFTFFTDVEKDVPANSTVEFDMLIPTEYKNFNEIIKYTGALKDGNWDWKSGSYGDLKSEDFIDLGNGYSKTQVKFTLASEIKGVKGVVVQIASYNCNYEGNIYLDNIKLVEKIDNETPVIPTVKDLLWEFNDKTAGLDGWSFGGSWDYKGTQDVSYDENNGALKLNVDYSKDKEVSWSEFKIQNNFKEAMSFNGYNLLTFDFIYNPSYMTQGAFQVKFFSNNAVNSFELLDLTNTEDLGNGFLKATGKVEFSPVDVNIDGMIIGIIGANTDYKGDILIDNIKLSQKAVEDIYVDITETPSNTQSKVEVNSLELPSNISLVDENTTKETASLYSYLLGVGKTDKVIFGHQNDTHHKVGKGDSNSDTKDLTGSISGIVGIDTLSFTGNELSLEGRPETDYVTAAANVGIDAANEGGIITLSAHMPNFELVKEKGLINGKYDYSGYTPGITTGDIVKRIMPGGDLNEVYMGYLNLIADYGLKLQDAGVPVLFRPFHENNGSWFWWGKAFCDEEAYKNLYRYTVEYLRDDKEVHNFLYVYSPNGPFNDEDEYLTRYPGDEFVDIIGFDMYHDNPSADDNWMDSFKETINLVDSIATEKGKLSIVAETGMRVLESLNDGKNYSGVAKSGNKRLNWYNEVLESVSGSNMPFFMVWANFDEGNFYMPYEVSDKRGHEMSNDFINFYNDDKSIFANGIGNYKDINANINEGYSYGYIKNPASGSRILNPITITASVKNLDGDVSFILKDNKGIELNKLKGSLKDGEYYADITKEVLDSIGETVGTIELLVGDSIVNKINVLYNMKEVVGNVEEVDTFESYLGEDVLLQQKWSTNAGPSCIIKPQLSTSNLNSGKFGLAFNYKISTEKTTEGWAGITTNKVVDWSKFNALQLWAKPDGQGQKLVIQVTSNGEDFEVSLPEFTKTTEAKLLTINFSDLKGKNGGTFDPSKIERVGIWCNTIVPKDHVGSWTVNSTMYFDDIKAIDTNAINEPSNVEVTGVKLSVNATTLKVGQTLNLVATINPTDATNKKLTWKTSDNTIASVDESGKVIAKKEGSVTITVKTEDGGYTDTCNIVVEKLQEEVTPPDNNNNNNNNNNGEDSNIDNSTSTEENKIENTLPNTGGVNSLNLLALASLITLAGIYLVKKTNIMNYNKK